MLITPRFKKSLIVEQFQGNYLNFLISLFFFSFIFVINVSYIWAEQL